jgi:radical SAM protein with 4Fe4S-binding SPASM domain
MEGKIPRILLYRPLFALLNGHDPTVGAMCSAGTNALTIMHDGTILPCRRLPIPIGNALTDSFYKVWYTSKTLWDIRNPENIKGKCSGCDLLAACRGCRALAYTVTGDYLAEDPQCWK